MARTCASCGVGLAKFNTCPDDLCGECQKILRPGHTRYHEWIKLGKPGKREILKLFPVRKVHRRTRAQILADHAKAAGTMPALVKPAPKAKPVPANPIVTEAASRMDVELLIACYHELKRRLREAKKLDGLRAAIHKE